MRVFLLFLFAVSSGAMLSLQAVMNSEIGRRAGVFGTVLILTIIGFVTTLAVVLLFPETSNLRNIPGFSEWYLYIGAFLGVIIMATPVILVPRIGASLTLTGWIVGQLLLSVVIDHFGWLNTPRIEIGLARIAGVFLLIGGAYLIGK